MLILQVENFRVSGGLIREVADMDRKQFETLKPVCQHEFGIHISNG
jgi:hypothetical protein